MKIKLTPVPNHASANGEERFVSNRFGIQSEIFDIVIRKGREYKDGTANYSVYLFVNLPYAVTADKAHVKIEETRAKSMQDAVKYAEDLLNWKE